MDDAKWERAAGAGGILFVVLVLISVILPGSPPMTSDSARDIAKWFTDNDDAIRYAAFVGIVATLPLVWWAAAFYRMLERATGNARLGVMVAIGVAVAAVAAAVSSVMWATVAIVGVGGAGGLDGTRFSYLFGTNINAMVGIGTALAVGAGSAGILRAGFMPKWIGWWGALVALVSAAASVVVMSTRDTAMLFLLLSAATFGIWLLAVSVVMLRSPAPAE